jgi:flagellar export protein FliJ
VKKYSFKLRTLLRVREIFADEAERRFRIAVQLLTAAVELLEDLRLELERLNRDLASLRNLSIDISIQLLYDRYFTRLRERIADQIEAVRLAEEEVELRRAELLEKIKDRKTMEELQMRDYERYLQELRHWEQSVIDDIATLRGGREAEAALKGASG